MKRFNIDSYKYFWFIGGFAVGYTIISLGHAALPNGGAPNAHPLPSAPVSEMKGAKVNSPEFDHDFAALNQLEGKYAENWNQQQRLRSAVARSRGQVIPKKKSAE